MSSKIRILPENMANRIAAGEVVERPAAVVKELVENAIDAGAGDILVEIAGGGRRLIKVSDDGSGMSREDALLSMERHATSKLSANSSLDEIATLGFRGEALPSIASVSRMILSTRENDSVEGVEIYAEGGRIITVKAHGMATGTTVEVRGLFFNTPARLKFMRSQTTEAGHVGELLTRMAISRPDIRFTYISEGKTQFKTLKEDLDSRIVSFLGRDCLNDLWPLNVSENGFALKGFIGGPSLARSGSAGLYTFINGRFIRDKVVQHAIMQAYRGVIDKGRYPVVVLFIEMPLQDVDINVHPTKHEVRFREQGKVHDHIYSALSELLGRSPWVKRSVPIAPVNPYQPAPPVNERRSGVQDALAAYHASGRDQLSAFNQFKTCIAGGAPRSPVPSGTPASEADSAGYYSSLAIIGQYKSMYIICQDGVDLVLVDQHAAHERIAYQRLRHQHAGCGVESQVLLFPETVELTFAESAALSENSELIEGMGFEVENFGGNTHVIKAVPRMIASTGYLSALRDILSDFVQLSRSDKAEQILESLLARIACHSVVRGNHQLSHPEMQALLKQMDATGFAGTCPHGRPVIVKLTLQEIEKMFKRTKSNLSD